MKEIEVKILEINKISIINLLESHGAQKLFEGEIEADFFMNSENKKLRLRKSGTKHILCYKKKMSAENVLSNIEYETEIGDPNSMISLLEGIGFKKYGYSKKYRISYVLGEIRFDIDKYEKIPYLVEIESHTQENVEKGVKILGYQMKDTSILTERTLKEYYGT